MRWAASRGLAVLVTATACSAAPAAPATTPAITTTASQAGAATVPTGSTVVDVTPSEASSTVVSTTIERLVYRIVDRVQGDEGDTVVVLVDPSSYEALTDIDLQNIVEDIVDRFPPILTVHVVDDTVVAQAVLDGAGAETEQVRALLMAHYLVRLEDGFRLVYQGPFSDTASVIIGS